MPAMAAPHDETAPAAKPPAPHLPPKEAAAYTPPPSSPASDEQDAPASTMQDASLNTKNSAHRGVRGDDSPAPVDSGSTADSANAEKSPQRACVSFDAGTEVASESADAVECAVHEAVEEMVSAAASSEESPGVDCPLPEARNGPQGVESAEDASKSSRVDPAVEVADVVAGASLTEKSVVPASDDKQSSTSTVEAAVEEVVDDLVRVAAERVAAERAPAEPVDDLESAVDSTVDSMISAAAVKSSLSAEREKVQGLINNLVGRAYDRAESPSKAVAPPLTGVPRGDARAWTAPAAEPIASLFWTQVPDTLTVTAVLRAPGATARDIRVVFGTRMLSVVVGGDVALREDLPQSLDADSCLWSLDRSNPELPSLTLELEKTRPGWWPVLFTSHDPAEYKLYSAASSAGGVPQPPPPQTETRASTADVPPPDGPPPADDESSVSVPKGDLAEDGHGKGGSGSKISAPVEGKASTSPAKVAATAAARREKLSNREDLDTIVSQYRTTFESEGPGAPEAALQLATFYHHGIGVERSDAEAARLYRYAMERGVVDNLAAFQLGLICNQGCEGMEADPKEAVRWWLVSARLGNAVAMFNLGVMFMNGSGCTMDPHVAMQFFQRAKAINPKLRTPDISPVQLAERVARAQRLKKQKQKADLSDEERQRRREEALETLRYAMYGTAAVVATSVAAVVIRNWWRNRL